MKDNTTTTMPDLTDSLPLAVRVYYYLGRKLIVSTPKNCTYGHNGFDECHCNDCIDAVLEMDEIKLGEIYFLLNENMNVKITGICPLEHCIDFHWKRLSDTEKGKLYGSCVLADLQPCR